MFRVAKYVFVLVFALIFIPSELNAQSKNIQGKIKTKFEQWKLDQYKTGTYVSDKNCNIDFVSKDGYVGSEMGISKDVDYFFTDLNNDKKIDAVITFYPVQCDGGNALMNLQIKLLILSVGNNYIVDDLLIKDIDKQFENGWLVVTKATNGFVYGTYFEYKENDGRCCPSVKKPFKIDYKLRKLYFIH